MAPLALLPLTQRSSHTHALLLHMPDMSISPTSTLHENHSAHSVVAKHHGPDMAEKGRAASPYDGEGTQSSPKIVKWLDSEMENPQNWAPTKKWCVPSPASPRPDEERSS